MPRQKKTETKKINRRGNNEGSIYQRKDGRWCAQVQIGFKENGKPEYKYSYWQTRQEAAAKVAELTNEIFEYGYQTEATGKSGLFYSQLMDWYVTFKEPTIQSKTSVKNRGYLKNHVKPVFEKLKIEQVDLAIMQKYFNGLRLKICFDSVKKIKQLLTQFYDYLVGEKVSRENIMTRVTVSQLEKEKQKQDAESANMALSPEMREYIIGQVQDKPVLKAIIVTLMLTGMRPGELIALKWRDIDFQKSIITIKHAAQRSYELDDKGNVISSEQVISNTKTALSVRSFRAPDSEIECLNEWLAYQKEQESKTGLILTTPDSYVFCTKHGTVRMYSGLRSLIRRFVDSICLDKKDFYMYKLRHTFATCLLEARENPKIVSEIMGHAKVTTTLTVYSHVVSNEVYEGTAQTLDNAFRDLNKKIQTNQCE